MICRTIRIWGLVLAVSIAPTFGAELPTAKPSRAGMSAKKLAEVFSLHR